MKKTSTRSQRGSRGIKGKHVLQICVLLGVCIWLIYQVKYSHDKKKEFYETDGKKLSEKEDGLVKLGRKDLLPGYHNQNEKEKHVEEDEDEEEKESKIKVKNGTHEEEEEKEEDEVAEEDEEDKSKLGEEVVEEDEEENKHEEDEIDEQDQSKTTEDKDDEPLEEEKEKETNHADEIDMTVDEAREEHYKADDASSAVSHESRILNTEKPKESSENSTGTAQENNTNATISEVEEVQKEPVLEKATTEVKDGDSESSTSEAKSVVTESRGETTVNGNSTEAVLEASGFLQNETRIMQERSQEDGAPPSGSSDVQTVIKLEQTGNESAPNVTVSANSTNIDPIQDDSRNSTSESSVIENISSSNTTETKENTRSEGGDDETVEYKESANHFSTEQTEEADDTTPESTMLQEEREALTDPQTLPDIRIEGNEEDEEAISAE
ncbi:hypothetical protein HA466_0032980 [Hirschfeldia incana]|nr:hypothetical protein HA466_0032980 [Hirschfeldia incana]